MSNDGCRRGGNVGLTCRAAGVWRVACGACDLWAQAVQHLQGNAAPGASNADFRVCLRDPARLAGARGGPWSRPRQAEPGHGAGEELFAVWCLSAAVAFAPVAAEARCVVVTSGTLAPMDGESHGSRDG
eukprot:COSAG01_NODE_1007_length_12161_cov_12.669624_3_plen_129_part_00